MQTNQRSVHKHPAVLVKGGEESLSARHQQLQAASAIEMSCDWVELAESCSLKGKHMSTVLY